LYKPIKNRLRKYIYKPRAYSLANGIPSQDAYLKNLIENVESVTKRMRWKAIFFQKGSTTQNQSSLSSNKSPPTIPLLKPFDDDLIKLIEKLT
jgi:hypothetical protein